MSTTRRVVALAAALALPLPARANGRFPAAQHVLVGPGRESRVIALRTTFGFAVSDDGGQRFHWICEDALQYAGPPFDPPFAFDPRGGMHVGIFDGLVHVAPDRCGFAREPAVEGQYVVDLDHHVASGAIALVTSSGGNAVNRVYRSDDGGMTIRPMGAGVRGVLFETLEMAPGDPQRVYLTGVRNDPRRVVAYRSDDGGATLRELPLPAAGLTGAFVAAVDPASPDTLYLRANLASPPSDGGTAPLVSTALLRSDDGGEHWREMARTRGPMLGFAIADDGRTLWIGGPDDGLFRSDDGGARWQRIGGQQVLCLRQHEGVLYVCANFVRDGYALGRSRDRGDSVQPLLRFQDIAGPVACPAGSPESGLCGPRWPLVQRMFGFGDTGMDAGSDAARDATGDAEMSPPRGCGCGVGTRGAAGRWLVVLAVVLARRSALRGTRSPRSRAGTLGARPSLGPSLPVIPWPPR